MSRAHNAGAAVTNGFFRKDEFRYDAAQDTYICPGGHELKPIRQGRLRDMRKVDYANPSACRDCSLRERCTNNYRAVSRLENEDALDRMEERIAARPDLLDRRREITEHPFGTIKQWMNQGAFPRCPRGFVGAQI
jgi:Transposase DDE domain